MFGYFVVQENSVCCCWNRSNHRFSCPSSAVDSVWGQMKRSTWSQAGSKTVQVLLFFCYLWDILLHLNPGKTTNRPRWVKLTQGSEGGYSYVYWAAGGVKHPQEVTQIRPECPNSCQDLRHVRFRTSGTSKSSRIGLGYQVQIRVNMGGSEGEGNVSCKPAGFSAVSSLVSFFFFF